MNAITSIIESREFYTDPWIITEFITDQERQLCIDIYDSLPAFEQATNEQQTKKDFLFHHPTDHRIRDMFWPKLQQIWPDKEIVVDGGSFTEWNHPNKIHTDSYQLEWKNPEGILGHAVLVPLRTDTGIGRPTTVFFDQISFATQIRNKDIKNTDRKTGIIPDLGKIENYTGRPFDRLSKFGHLVSHCEDDVIHGFSLQSAVEWEYNSAIIWHRSQFHCSGAFNGEYNKKLHLVFFINFK